MTETANPRVFVTGAKWQLGAAVMARLAETAEVNGVELDDLDITRPRDVPKLVRGLGPDVLINCAAFNAVDEAERRPLEAMRCNGEAVWTLASLAEEVGAVLVHYSTIISGADQHRCE